MSRETSPNVNDEAFCGESRSGNEIDQYYMDENSAQQRINNLSTSFPEFAHILLEKPHKIESDIVLNLNGAPNHAVGPGRKFSKPEIVTRFVSKDEKRVSLTLAVSFEEQVFGEDSIRTVSFIVLYFVGSN